MPDGFLKQLDFWDEWVALFWGQGMDAFRTRHACVREELNLLVECEIRNVAFD